MTPPACRESATAPAYNAAMPRIPYKYKLLHVPYRPPRLQVGARTDGNLRGIVVITSWTEAKISWLRCLLVASKGHPSLLLDDELARAVRTEAAAAVGYLPLGAHFPPLPFFVNDEPLVKRLLPVARLADPESRWRDRFRNADN
jgi:hypothetical protein